MDFVLIQKLKTGFKKFLLTIYTITILKRRLKRQLSLRTKNRIDGQKPTKKVLITLFETSHYQHQHLLALGKALQLRGVEILVLICGERLKGCEIKSVKNVQDNDPCWRCRFFSKHTLPLYELSVKTLNDYLSELEYQNIVSLSNDAIDNKKELIFFDLDFTQTIKDSIERYYYGNKPDAEKEINDIKKGFLISALISYTVATKIKSEWNPDISLTNQWIYSWQWPFYQIFDYRLINSSSFDFNSVQFNLPDLFPAKTRFEEYITSRNSYYLSKIEKRKIEQLMDDRLNGNTAKSKLYKYFDESTDVSFFEKLKNDKRRKILLCSNIYWDAGLSEAAFLYDDVLSWVFDTVDIALNHPDLHLLIKPHPGELFDSQPSLKGVSSLVKEKYDVLPPNVTILEPEWKLNTYDLFSYIDLGVIFTGTLGLEMMYAGIPVISTGKTTHFGLGLSSEPNSRSDYIEMLLGISPYNVDKDLLLLFLYFYFIKTNIPWTLTEQSFGDRFKGFEFANLEDLKPGQNKYLDHLCNCVINRETTTVENW